MKRYCSASDSSPFGRIPISGIRLVNAIPPAVVVPSAVNCPATGSMSYAPTFVNIGIGPIVVGGCCFSRQRSTQTHGPTFSRPGVLPIAGSTPTSSDVPLERLDVEVEVRPADPLEVDARRTVSS